MCWSASRWPGFCVTSATRHTSAFVASGMTEEELAERLEREDHIARGVPYDE